MTVFLPLALSDLAYMDINDKFVTADGTLRKDLLPDLLHPNEKGYQVWAESIEPMVSKLMGDTEKK